jgi:putative cell wall-binding protein
MKKYLNLIITFLFALLSITNLTSCSKDSTGAEIKLTQQMLSEKTWFLDYSITGTSKRTYLGQSYFIDFFKNDSTIDSDGLNGKYSVEKIGNILQIHVTAKTSSINSVDYEIIYNIESIGRRNLILYFTLPGETVPTKRYFSTKN